MFQAWQIAPVGQKAVHVFSDGVILVPVPEAVEFGDYSGKLLVNG